MSCPTRAALKRASNIALVALFVIALSLPMLLKTLGLCVSSLNENRRPAPRPPLRLAWKDHAKYRTKYEAYFNDSFSLRDQLIMGNNFVKVRWLGVSPSAKVLVGDRGWLYYAADGSVDDYRHTRPFTTEQLEHWRQTYEARRDWLARQGIHYLIVIAPNKHTIYPEFVPGRIHPVQGPSRYDQLYAYLRAHTNLTVLDLREPLMKAKSWGRLYYRLDTHWNDRGAFVAYQTIIDALGRWYPGARALPPSAFIPSGVIRPDSDLSLMVGLGKVLPDRDVMLTPRFARRAHLAFPGAGLTPDRFPGKSPVATECDVADLPRTLVFRDSFSVSLIPFLSEHFSRILYIWHASFDATIVERERPRIVIEEAVEQSLWRTPPPVGVPDAIIARK